MKVTDALRRKIDLTIGRPETERERIAVYAGSRGAGAQSPGVQNVRDVGFALDGKLANERALSRRHQADFERRLREMHLADSDEDDTSDDDDEEEGTEDKAGVGEARDAVEEFAGFFDPTESPSSPRKAGPTSRIPRGRIAADLDWSEQGTELDAMTRSRRQRGKTSFVEICKRLRSLKLRNCGITEMDGNLRDLEGLEELNLCRNKIRCIRNLPSSLVSFQAFDNDISRIELSDVPGLSSKLVHLGVGYNQISSLQSWIEDCAALVSLDLSFNNLCALEGTLAALKDGVPHLRILHLQGNPLALLAGYREAVHRALPDLEILDGISFESESSEPRADVDATSPESAEHEASIADADESEAFADQDGESIRMMCLVSCLDVIAAAEAKESPPTDAEDEAAPGNTEAKDAEAGEDDEDAAAEENQSVPFQLRFLSVRVTLLDEHIVESELLAWPEKPLPRVEEEEDDPKKKGKKAPGSANKGATEIAEDDTSESNEMHFDIELEIPRTVRPSVALRDGLELSGVRFDVICTLQTCLEVKATSDIAQDGAEDEAESADETGGAPQDPVVEVVSARRIAIAHGALDVSQSLAPGRAAVYEAASDKLALDVENCIPGQKAFICAASLAARFTLR